MAQTKKGPIPLSEAGLIEDTVARIKDGGKSVIKGAADKDGNPVEIDSKIVKIVLVALKEEIVASITSGYKVGLTGLCSFVPKVVNGAKAGSKKHNPSTGEETIVKKDEPDTLGYRVGRSAAVTNAFPSLRTNAGKELLEQLRLPPPKKKPAAPAAAAAKGGPKKSVA